MIRRRHDERGQSLVEMALILPIFVLVLVAIFDLGHVVWVNDTLGNAAREAARYAIVHGDKTTGGTKQDIKDVAIDWASNAGASATVTVCGGTGCTGDTDLGVSFPYSRGTPVTVTVSGDVSLGAPSVLGLGPFHLSSSSTMLVNH
jgi:Flp pilus assembly protein TadG